MTQLCCSTASTLTPSPQTSPSQTGTRSSRWVRVWAKFRIVGDVSGDLIDDVVLIYPASVGLAPVPFVAGLFFGATDGFPDTLTLPEADVLFRGELPAARFTWGPDAAGVGDVNGDGLDDLLLGDPSGASGDGLAYLIPGRRGDWPEDRRIWPMRNGV